MSVEVMGWAFKLQLETPSQKLTLLALADHADDDGECWPSHKSLAIKSSQSIRSVQRRLGELVKLGVLVKLRRHGTSSIYRIQCHQPLIEIGQSGRSLPAGAGSATGGRGVRPLVADRTIIEPSTDSDSKESESVIRNTLFAETKQELPRKQARRAKRQAMPQNWEPDDKGLQFARECGFAEAKIRQLVVACRDYHLKHGTMIAGVVGLAATWRTWCNNEIKFTEERKARYGRSSNGPRPTREESILAGVRAAARGMAGQRDDRRTDETIFDRGNSGADAAGAGRHRLEGPKH